MTDPAQKSQPCAAQMQKHPGRNIANAKYAIPATASTVVSVSTVKANVWVFTKTSVAEGSSEI